MTGTPDDVQRAAARLSTLDTEQILGDKCRRLSKAFWAAGDCADILIQSLIDQGWTPPGVMPHGPDQLQAAHDAGYAEGQRESQAEIAALRDAYQRGWEEALASLEGGQTVVTTSPEDWTPVPLRWRHVRPGDVFVADGRTWMVGPCGEHGDREAWKADVVSGEEYHYSVPVDPDEVVPVLCPATEANALARIRDELGGTVVDRSV